MDLETKARYILSEEPTTGFKSLHELAQGYLDLKAEVERLRERNEKLLDLIGPSLPAIVDAYERWLIEQGE